jgi:transposase
MEHYAGIDVSLEQSSVCVVDGTGRIVREAKVASEPEALSRFLGQPLGSRPDRCRNGCMLA